MAMLTDFMSSAEDPRFLQSIKSHPRYHLRLTAIIAVAFGIFFNVLAIAIAQVFILSGLAFLPVRTPSHPMFFCLPLTHLLAVHLHGLEPCRSRLKAVVQKGPARLELGHCRRPRVPELPRAAHREWCRRVELEVLAVWGRHAPRIYLRALDVLLVGRMWYVVYIGVNNITFRVAQSTVSSWSRTVRNC